MSGERAPSPAPRGTRRGYWRRLRRQKEEILNVRADAAERQTPLERGLAGTARVLANPFFFAAELLFHLAWVLLNTVAPEPLRWDSYPFPLLAGIASVQALFIGLLILMYEERNEQVGEIREETDLQVSLHTERETTKLLRMMREVHEALGIQGREQDGELQEMSQPLDPQRLREVMETRLRELDQK